MQKTLCFEDARWKKLPEGPSRVFDYNSPSLNSWKTSATPHQRTTGSRACESTGNQRRTEPSLDSQFNTEAREVQRNSACGLEQGQELVNVFRGLPIRTDYLFKMFKDSELPHGHPLELNKESRTYRIGVHVIRWNNQYSSS